MVYNKSFWVWLVVIRSMYVLSSKKSSTPSWTQEFSDQWDLDRKQVIHFLWETRCWRGGEPKKWHQSSLLWKIVFNCIQSLTVFCFLETGTKLPSVRPNEDSTPRPRCKCFIDCTDHVLKGRNLVSGWKVTASSYLHRPHEVTSLYAVGNIRYRV